jgi:hypothetical protein
LFHCSFASMIEKKDWVQKLMNNYNNFIFMLYQLLSLFWNRDLSETSISKLPTLGFDTLETLKLQNTFTLKEIPSVMNFKNIRTAFLTYPYHCCAFKFPATHNPKEFARYQDMFKKDMEKRFASFFKLSLFIICYTLTEDTWILILEKFSAYYIVYKTCEYTVDL